METTLGSRRISSNALLPASRCPRTSALFSLLRISWLRQLFSCKALWQCFRLHDPTSGIHPHPLRLLAMDQVHILLRLRLGRFSPRFFQDDPSQPGISPSEAY